MNITTWENERIKQLEKENKELYAYLFDMPDHSFIFSNIQKYAEYGVDRAFTFGEFTSDVDISVIHYDSNIEKYFIYDNGECVVVTEDRNEAIKIFAENIEGNN